MNNEIHAPCPDCGQNRWKTIAKGKAWQCRRCKHVRVPGREEEKFTMAFQKLWYNTLGQLKTFWLVPRRWWSIRAWRELNKVKHSLFVHLCAEEAQLAKLSDFVLNRWPEHIGTKYKDPVDAAIHMLARH